MSSDKNKAEQRMLTLMHHMHQTNYSYKGSYKTLLINWEGGFAYHDPDIQRMLKLGYVKFERSVFTRSSFGGGLIYRSYVYLTEKGKKFYDEHNTFGPLINQPLWRTLWRRPRPKNKRNGKILGRKAVSAEFLRALRDEGFSVKRDPRDFI